MEQWKAKEYGSRKASPDVLKPRNIYKNLFLVIIIIIIIIIIIKYLIANWLSPGGSGYYACT